MIEFCEWFLWTLPAFLRVVSVSVVVVCSGDINVCLAVVFVVNVVVASCLGEIDGDGATNDGIEAVDWVSTRNVEDDDDFSDSDESDAALNECEDDDEIDAIGVDSVKRFRFSRWVAINMFGLSSLSALLSAASVERAESKPSFSLQVAWNYLEN